MNVNNPSHAREDSPGSIQEWQYLSIYHKAKIYGHLETLQNFSKSYTHLTWFDKLEIWISTIFLANIYSTDDADFAKMTKFIDLNVEEIMQLYQLEES